MRRFYFTNENADNVANDHVGNIRGARTKAQKIANERGETIVINDCRTEEMIDFIYPDNLAVTEATTENQDANTSTKTNKAIMKNTTMVQALEEMKKRGVKTLSGMAGQDSAGINIYLNHAKELHELAVKYAAEGIESWQYDIDHANDHDLIDIDGHLCVVTHYDTHSMATYGDFPTEAEMQAAYQDYQNREMAAEIAREKAATNPEFPYEIWYAIALKEVESEMARLDAEFKAMFPAQPTEGGREAATEAVETTKTKDTTADTEATTEDDKAPAEDAASETGHTAAAAPSNRWEPAYTATGSATSVSPVHAACGHMVKPTEDKRPPPSRKQWPRLQQLRQPPKDGGGKESVR